MTTVTVAPTEISLELPDELPPECLGIQTFVVGYHHALGTDAWRRLMVERLDAIKEEVRQGLHDPHEGHDHEEEHR